MAFWWSQGLSALELQLAIRPAAEWIAAAIYGGAWVLAIVVGILWERDEASVAATQPEIESSDLLDIAAPNAA